jgi:hypothetical protein
MDIKDHALVEFKASGWLDEPVDLIQKMMMDGLIEIIEVFAGQGHSGFSANYAIGCLEKLLRFEPLVPLTGEDWEWQDVSSYGGHMLKQNKRCSRVFMHDDGKFYDTEGRIFVSKDGGSYTSKDSYVEITFPYTPKREYVNEI